MESEKSVCATVMGGMSRSGWSGGEMRVSGEGGKLTSEKVAADYFIFFSFYSKLTFSLFLGPFLPRSTF
jgi:hypothetical protein